MTIKVQNLHAQRLLLASCLLVCLVVGTFQQVHCGYLDSIWSRSAPKGDSNSMQEASALDAPGPVRLQRAKANKVSKLLHMVHEASGKYVYQDASSAEAVKSAEHKSKQDEANSPASQTTARQLGEQQDEITGPNKEPNWAALDDQQVLSSACQKDRPRLVCQMVVTYLLHARRLRPERARIAAAIRAKPAGVRASKVMFHSLFALTVDKLEAGNYDEKLNTLVDLVATKSPYGFAAIKAIDMLSKLKH